MNCKNCGASIDKSLSKCPYCGAMISKGALKEYRINLFSFKDKIDRLDDDGYKTLNELVIKAIFSSILIVIICIITGIICAFIFKPITYDSKQYNQELYNDIIWADDNFEIMDKLYNNQNYDELMNYINDKPSICHNRYHHYDIMMVVSNYKYLLNSLSYLEDNEELNKYNIKDILDVLYYEKISRNINFDEDERLIYENIKDELYDIVLKFGLDQNEIEQLFNQSYKDGYIDSSLLVIK